MAPSTAAKGATVGAARGQAAKGATTGAAGGQTAKGATAGAAGCQAAKGGTARAAGGQAAKGATAGAAGGQAAKGMAFGTAGGKAAAAVVASPAGALTLKAAGFTTDGPAAGSFAANWMSDTAIANDGRVRAGCLYSFVQATGMGVGLLRGAPAKLTVGAVARAGAVVSKSPS